MNTIMFGFVLFLLSKKMLKKIKFVLGAIVGSGKWLIHIPSNFFTIFCPLAPGMFSLTIANISVPLAEGCLQAAETTSTYIGSCKS